MDDSEKLETLSTRDRTKTKKTNTQKTKYDRATHQTTGVNPDVQEDQQLLFQIRHPSCYPYMMIEERAKCEKKKRCIVI
jgi:hypothetical protein